MIVEQRIFVREVHIVRQTPDAPWHSHQKIIVEYLDPETGEIISAKLGEAEPLSVDDIGDVLSPAFIDITNERDDALAGKAIALQQRAEALAGKASAEEERDAALATVEDVTADIGQLQTQIAALQAEIAALQAADAEG